jgi:excisionase family DNA binding protein
MTITQAARYLGYKVKTLQKWDREGTLKSTRTPTNRRVYTQEQLDSFLGLRSRKVLPTRQMAYCRVSSTAQRNDLKNQRSTLEDFCLLKGFSNVEFVEEIGGGLNFKRKSFLDIMDAVDRRDVKTLIVAHKDRLTRFGFDWFERFCSKHGCELLVLNQEKLSPETEMVQDLMTIVHCFSSRLYGLRNYKKKIKEAIDFEKQE